MKGFWSLSPLLFFILVYLVTSIVVQDFYKVPITVAFLLSSVYAIATLKGNIRERVNIFSKGAGDSDLMLMLWIFILAGAFASTAKAMGAVDATVNLTLTLLPNSFLLPGIFIAACFISLAVGTSVGTIAALTPVAVGIASESALPTPFVVAIVIGGAYFGDNLSFISDTTIVATQTQRCKMSDKFKVNSRIVFPIALLMAGLYFYLGQDMKSPEDLAPINPWKVVPYLAVILTAVFGLNVMLVLILGTVLTGAIGMIDGSFDLFGWFKSMADGMLGMSELIIMTLLAGGMFSIIRHNGGIDYLINKLTRHIHGARGAEGSIAGLVALVNVCTANNTVAIMTTGPIARDIAEKYGLDNRKTASLLDTMSCCTQGLLPYGAQMLIASGLAALNPISILPYLFYPMALGLGVVVCVLFRYPRKYSTHTARL